jgi:spermidine synthase
MPDPGAGNVFLEDARQWVERRRRLLEHSERLDRLSFDIVVHDCFSGGAVPEHLFTIQFWDDLKYLMHKNGVVVVVGSLSSLHYLPFISTLTPRILQERRSLTLRKPF